MSDGRNDIDRIAGRVRICIVGVVAIVATFGGVLLARSEPQAAVALVTLAGVCIGQLFGVRHDGDNRKR